MNVVYSRFGPLNSQLHKPLGQSMGEAMLACSNSWQRPSSAPESLSKLPEWELDEYNGLRDAEQGNQCLTGQTDAYYHGYSYGYHMEQGDE